MGFLTRAPTGRTARFLTAAALLLCLVRPAAAGDLNEQKIKAGLIYNFLKYTEWKALGPDRKIEVCLFGNDALIDYLMPLQGRTAQQHPINIVRIGTLERVPACNLVFLSKTEEGMLAGVLDAAAGKGVLTISDIGSFTRRGGMAELSTQDDQRIHLLINKYAVQGAGLRIENRLLNLAEGAGQE